MVITLSVYLILVGASGVFVSASVLTTFNEDDSLRIFKEPANEFEYVLKRHGADIAEEPDSKERRSNVGSSFIRFGRSQSLVDNSFDNSDSAPEKTENDQVSRHPRWKSPDIVIRFGRSNVKSHEQAEPAFKRGKADNFIRFGRNSRTSPTYLSLPAMCNEILSTGSNNRNKILNHQLRPYQLRLWRLCNALKEIDSSYNLDFIDDGRIDPTHE